MSGMQFADESFNAENQEKNNVQMMSNFASLLKKNPGNIESISYKVKNLDGTENAELSMTTNDGGVQPPREDIHMDEIVV